MARDRLKLVRAFTLPLGELSGLCLHSAGGQLELLAISDASHELLRAPVEAGSSAFAFRAIDLAPVLGAGGASQWEAVVADAAGQVYLLEENPGAVSVLSPDLRRRVGRVELSFAEEARRRKARDDDNSRGEGLALLGSGHLLVAKEKRPARLVELGASGGGSRGVSRELLLPGPGFALPEAGRLHELASWSLDDADVEDVSDLAVTAEGRLFLLSDQSRCIVELEPLLPAGGGAARALGRWELPKRVRKPEGLTFLADGTPLVVSDDDEGEENLFVLEPLS